MATFVFLYGGIVMCLRRLIDRQRWREKERVREKIRKDQVGGQW